MHRARFKMPRPRKYDYQKDLPETIFITVPLNLKQELSKMMTNKELSDIVSNFLLDYVEKNRNI